MLVFMTVFSLTVFFNTPFNYTETKGEKTKTEKTGAKTSDTMAQITEAPVIHSLSYDFDISSYDDSQYSDEYPDSGAADAEENATAQGTAAVTGAGITPTLEPALTPASEPEATPTSKPKEESKYSKIGISVAKDYVNIREKASTESKVLGKLYKGGACEIKDSKDGWYYVESGSVTGYVNSDFIKTGIPDDELISKYGTLSISVACDGLNVRDDKSTDAKKLTVVYTNEIYPVVKEEGEWLKIKIPDEDLSGYVKSEFTKLIVEFKEAVSREEEELLAQLAAEKKAKQETQIKKRESTDYDYDDLQLLSCLIHAEAGSQSYETKLAVANVVLNRIRNSGDSMKGVIYQAGQFTVAASGSLQKQLDRYDHYSSKAELVTIKAAKDALAGSNNIGSRTHFNSYYAAVNKGYDHISTAVKMGGLLFWQ